MTRRVEMKGYKNMYMTILVLTVFSLFCFASGVRPAQAAEHVHETLSLKHKPGKEIRRINLKGYTLMYHLLDLSERAEMMKTMEGHSVLGMKKSPDTTNHLMVYIEKPDGKIVQADVAFLLTGPEGKDFTTMTMGMYGGYGADINMKLKGVYAIKTKIAKESGDVRLEDEFTFEVK